MFLSLAKLFADAGRAREDALLVHPVQLSRWLDEAWSSTSLVPELPIGSTSTKAPFLGANTIIDTLRLPTQLPPALLAPSGIIATDPRTYTDNLGPPTGGIGLLWHHLIYAYLVESTGVLEVFSEVVKRLVSGETLGTLTPDSARWQRATEELFLRDPPLFSISGITSEVRPSARTNRRNAYWRMLGWDLPHLAPSIPDWKSHVGLGVNADFRAKWFELLRQVWKGLENTNNTSGSNPTDPAYIALLCVAIKDMLNNRRRGGLLAREEFVYVTVLSWFHLTLQTDTPIVVDLQARATSPADRLSLIAQRVGLTPAPRSRELFDLAEPMSSVLRAIELGLFDTETAASTLFATGTPLAADMRNLINNWQSATGQRVKDQTIPVSDQPLRVPTPLAAAVGSGSMPGFSAPVVGANGYAASGYAR